MRAWSPSACRSAKAAAPCVAVELFEAVMAAVARAAKSRPGSGTRGSNMALVEPRREWAERRCTRQSEAGAALLAGCTGAMWSSADADADADADGMNKLRARATPCRGLPGPVVDMDTPHPLYIYRRRHRVHMPARLPARRRPMQCKASTLAAGFPLAHFTL
jgi:hypothetical protein